MEMKNSYLSFLLIPFLLLVPSVAYGAEWYDSNWLKTRAIETDSGDFDSDLTNYPLSINITSIDLGTDTQSDCDDVILVNYYNTTILDYELENCDTTNDILEMWVRLPTAYSANATRINMYYDYGSATDQQSTQATWNSNYSMVLHLNNTLLDSTDQGNDCDTNQGSTNHVNEHIGDSRHFDGINDECFGGLSASGRAIFDGGGTISAWINPNSDGGGNQARWLDTANTAFTGFMSAITDDDNSASGLYFQQRNNPNPNGNWFTTNDDIIPLNQWSYVTVVFNDDSASNNPLLYVNGISYAVTEFVVPGSAFTNPTGDFFVGDNYASDVRQWDGEIDEVRMNSISLSTDWIESDYECQRQDNNNSCIIIGDEQTEPSGAQTVATTDEIALEDVERTVSVVGSFTRNTSDEIALEDNERTASSSGSFTRNTSDEIALEDNSISTSTDTVFVSDEIALEDTERSIGEFVPPNFNAIILSLNSPELNRLGGVFAITCPANSTLTGLLTNGTFVCTDMADFFP